MIDVIVVGSGPAGAQAAARLVEEGLRVVMLDVGNDDAASRARIPVENFTELRQQDEDQADYFLGKNFEGIPLGKVRVGAQLTPPRQFLYRQAQELLPLKSGDFEAMQSLALGGLGAGWGAAVPPLMEAEMAGWPIAHKELWPHYEVVAKRIGVCGTDHDDLAPYLGKGSYLLPPSAPDDNASLIKRIYTKKKKALNRKGFYLGAPRLAMTTAKFRGRGPFPGTDMEFWADHNDAVYRPRVTIKELLANDCFSYDGDALVEKFEQTDGSVRISIRRAKAQTSEVLECRQLILCAGTLSTSRIVLRSIQKPGVRLPLLCNPYTYYPCLLWPRLGQKTSDQRHSLTQLMMIYEPQGAASRLVQTQFYSYRSLLTFKLMKEVPFAAAVSRRMLQLMMDYFVIAGVHHEDRPSAQKYVTMESFAENQPLAIQYKRTLSEERRRNKQEGAIKMALYGLGLIPLKRIDPGKAASIHYAGTLPMQSERRPFTTDTQGRLDGFDRVRIADGSVLPHLPAKGLTFTIMANADRIAELLARQMHG